MTQINKSPVKFRSDAAFARALGISRQLLYVHRQRGGPCGRDIDKWREHLVTFSRTKIASQFDQPGTSGRSRAITKSRTRQIVLQNERLEMRIKDERDGLIPRILAEQIFAKLVRKVKHMHFNLVDRIVELSRTIPDTQVAAQAVRKEIISIWTSLADGQWINENPKLKAL